MNTRIRKIRKSLDLTQREFGERIGIKANTVTMIEKGRATSDQTIQAICREFRVNEDWLRTGNGEMFLPPPSDAIDDMIEQYKLPHEFRSLIDKYLDLKPEQQEAVVEYMRKVAADLMGQEAPATIPNDPPPWGERPRWTAEQHAVWESEARTEAEEVYRQILQEKKAAAESSASPPDLLA